MSDVKFNLMFYGPLMLSIIHFS